MVSFAPIFSRFGSNGSGGTTNNDLITAMFDGSEEGFAFDFTAFEGAYQDAARTTAVTATGQNVLGLEGLNGATATIDDPTVDGSTFSEFEDDGNGGVWYRPENVRVILDSISSTTGHYTFGFSGDIQTVIDTVAGDEPQYFFDSANGRLFLQQANGGWGFFDGSSSTDGTAVTGIQTLVKVLDPTDYQLYKNGTLDTEILSEYTSTNIGGTTVFFARNSGRMDNNFVGRVYRLFFIDRILTTAERDVLDNWLAESTP